MTGDNSKIQIKSYVENNILKGSEKQGKSLLRGRFIQISDILTRLDTMA